MPVHNQPSEDPRLESRATYRFCIAIAARYALGRALGRQINAFYPSLESFGEPVGGVGRFNNNKKILVMSFF